ncbi:DNA mismatch repair protein [Clostridium polyendosporum]|uniref:DNA mismatch repair protein n=1 Tax=Clostridium polyendosporum TaxID=69208 RepID=A0A919RZM7_9CLOT|nr:MutS family DNA mismatch repair protein [Clostridium polyendosporum]GIM29184.1 DNA mismatch repair protein [Clostridium polyendosporum]
MDKNFYYDRISKGEEEFLVLKNLCNNLSILRLIISISMVLFTIILYKMDKKIYIASEILGMVILFIIIAYFHSQKLEEKKRKELYIEVNKQSLQRIEGEWKYFNDCGEDLKSSEHPFVNDLDVFGKNSLFQWINATITSFGREVLRELLSLKELPNKNEILKRQEALKELGCKVDFRQQLQIEGRLKDNTFGNTSTFIQWSMERNENILKNYMTMMLIVCPAALLSITLLYFITGKIPSSIPLGITLLNFLILKLGTKERNEALNMVYELKNKIFTYFRLLEIIEKEEFKCKKLVQLKDKLKSLDQSNFSRELKELNSIAAAIMDRKNMVYIVINVALLWDYHLLVRLERWRRKNSANINRWFKTLGEIEALCSLANISGDHYEWTYPEITDDLILQGDEIGHPLLGGKAVRNSFNLDKEKRIMLVTGSNMSGKSTFLRTVGINLLLSYMGAPTFSKSFKCPVVNIYTSMRTGDNLEENISSFYAEILRVKMLVEAVERGERVFFLLDEIFKGTNSADRHTGAEILIRQISEKSAIGFVSTHDLELCDLEGKNKSVINYNFREYYKDNKIKFDYKLRRGRSTTRNAVYLMKLAGIKIK